jgi:hypothetical protein
MFCFAVFLLNLITVRQSSHPRHNSQNVEISSVDTDLSSGVITDGVGGKDKLKGSVINSGEIASSGRLVLFWAEGQGSECGAGMAGRGRSRYLRARRSDPDR